MRAYMSAPNTFPADSPMRPGCCGHPVDAWEEACAILAETEPTPIELHRHVAARATAYEYEDEAQASLAEALSAFVEA